MNLSVFLKSITMSLNSKKQPFILFLTEERKEKKKKEAGGKNKIVFSVYNVWTFHHLRIHNSNS